MRLSLYPPLWATEAHFWAAWEAMTGVLMEPSATARSWVTGCARHQSKTHGEVKGRSRDVGGGGVWRVRSEVEGCYSVH